MHKMSTVPVKELFMCVRLHALLPLLFLDSILHQGSHPLHSSRMPFDDIFQMPRVPVDQKAS